MHGILPLWKPKGLTSHDCVFKIRKLFGLKKVGHTGTLDPEVEGVLVICLGQATKLVPFLMDTNKTYIAKVKLGKATETEDQVGKVIEEKNVSQFPDDDTIKKVLARFKGEITQVPPMYSAVKVQGKRLYEYARRNEVVERPVRHVNIFELQYLGKHTSIENTISILVTCSKGTYIRTLCVDIGKKLGYPSHMAELVRLETSNFSKEDTFTFEQLYSLKEEGQLESSLYPLQRGILHLPTYDVTNEIKKRVSHGQKLKNPYPEENIGYLAMLHNEKLIAVYQPIENNKLAIEPVRVFNAE